MKRMNRNTLKYIAVVAMLLDHIGMFFVPVTTLPGMLLRVVGRLTAPIMCFFLAEGFRHTSSRKKYGLRLLVFGLISQIPYALAHYGTLLKLDFNMILTLFLSFLILLVWDDMKGDPRQIPAIVILLIMSNWCDWGLIGPMFTLAFYICGDNRQQQAKVYSILAGMMVLMDVIVMVTSGNHWYGELWQLGLYLFLPFLFLYNGEGGSRHPFHKWFFYVVYPLHLLIIFFIK